MSEGDLTPNASLLTSISDVNRNQWNNLVNQSDSGSLFHRHEWLTAVETGLDCQPHHGIIQKSNNPIAIFPNFVSALSLPHPVADQISNKLQISFIHSTRPGYGGPIILSDENECIDRLLNLVSANNGRRVVYHLIRTNSLEHIRYGKFFHAHGFEPMLDKCIFLIDLNQGWDSIFENMDKERRKAIRKARQQNHDIQIFPISEDLGQTFESYRRNMLRVSAKIIPRSFFEALAEYLDDRVRVFAAEVDGEEVGRYVYLLDYERSILFHWLSAIPETGCFESSPSELLHERAIKWGIENGFSDYNFHVTGAHFDDSIFKFKSKFGGQPIPILRWQKGESNLFWKIFKYARFRQLVKDVHL